MINFEYSRAATVAGALDILSKNPRAGFIAGGTNLIDLMKRGVASPTRLIDINNLPLKEIVKGNNGLRIGALALNSDVAMNDTLIKEYPLLSLALHAGASPQLRNMATVGGNMMQRTRCTYFYDTTMPCNKRNPNSGCGALQGYNRMHAIFTDTEKCIAVHPSDMCVALAALDAEVTLKGKSKERKIPFVNFHRLPGNTPEKDNTLANNEMITEITIPSNSFNKNFYLKIRDRASYAFALVSVAVSMEVNNGTIKNARLAMGGVAHKPWRFNDVEAFLLGKPATNETFISASNLAMKGAKSFGQNDFKLKLAPAAIIQAFEAAMK